MFGDFIADHFSWSKDDWLPYLLLEQLYGWSMTTCEEEKNDAELCFRRCNHY
ncbi:hypothetical protein KHA80_05575 [Anaerobacillus sp. HL2]|nr:hypothetical protein KHA80_05575 [Anaerobacillus sp. HL2]